eukprot:sb/3467358/
MSLNRGPTTGNFPVRWTPVEAIRHRRYSEKSDVYSMGVVLWEMFTFGEEPWGNLTNEQVLEKLHDQKKMERPHSCPDLVYKTMLKCWDDDFMKRPTFSELQIEIESLTHTIDSCCRSEREKERERERERGRERDSERERKSVCACEPPQLTIVPPRNQVTIELPVEEDDCLSVGNWLASMGLQQYQSHFINTALHSVEFCVELQLRRVESYRSTSHLPTPHRTCLNNVLNIAKLGVELNEPPQLTIVPPRNQVTIELPVEEDDCLSVGNWLASMGLQQYQSHFINTGSYHSNPRSNLIG